jgi:hypothetical protein
MEKQPVENTPVGFDWFDEEKEFPEEGRAEEVE